MTGRLPAPPPAPADPAEPARPGRAALLAAGAALLALVIGAAALLALAIGERDRLAGASPTQDPGSYAYAELRPAPPLPLTAHDGTPFELAALRGGPVLVFFGYTHCPDVCPATVGTVNEVVLATGGTLRAVFVTVDPERDDVEALASYLAYLPDRYTALTGSTGEIAAAAAAWGVDYARVETGSADGYAMAHTADLFLVDAAGWLRARFPFGTPAATIAAALARVTADPVAAAPTPVAAPTAAPAASGGPVLPVDGRLVPELVSAQVWAGGASPVVVRVADRDGSPLDGTVPVRFRLVDAAGAGSYGEVAATAIRPPGLETVSWIAFVDLPAPGPWRLDVVAADGRSGSAPLEALDPGGTAPLGRPAPPVDTPTLADVGGTLLLVSTLPQADPRLYEVSTADALAAGRPYVLVVDSARFKVSPACGRALAMVRYMLDRWPGVAYVHLEPFEYQLVTDEPVLAGTLEAPILNRWARAFGIGDAAWPATSVPWIFVVDGDGILRAKYTGIFGSADVDVVVSLLEGAGIMTP